MNPCPSETPKNRTKTSQWLCRLALASLFASPVSSVAQNSAETLEVKLGEVVDRSWTQVRDDNFAYGPKQDFEETTGETQIWLPYGTNAPYYELAGLKVTDPGVDRAGVATLVSMDGHTPGHLTYKLHFDKPIEAFRFKATDTEVGLKHAAAGIEYSTDGEKWSPIAEWKTSGIINRSVDAAKVQATGLKTRDLYLRIFARDEKDPEARRAENVFLKMWMSGDPSWGDASTTFFDRQLQVWVRSLE